MILLYHLIFADSTRKDSWNAGNIIRISDFKRQLMWLKDQFEIITLENYVNLLFEGEHKVKGKYALTFDDGYKAVINLVLPFLLEEQIPATFFITTSHLEDEQLLWFVYINALCSENYYSQIEINNENYDLTTNQSRSLTWNTLIKEARESGNPIEFIKELSIKYPLSIDIHEKYAGATQNQLRRMSENSLISIGGHTYNHPYLDQITKEEQHNQIIKNKTDLEVISGKKITLFAYPSGIFNPDSIEVVKKIGFSAAFAVELINENPEKRFTIPRVGIYSSSMTKFALKTLGIHTIVRKIMAKYW